MTKELMTENNVYVGMMVLASLQLANAPKLNDTEIMKPLLRLWTVYLNKYSYAEYETAIYLYAKSNRWFPTISDIIKLIPIPSKYFSPEQIFSVAIKNSYDTIVKDTRGDLVLKAIKLAGYNYSDLKRFEKRDIIETRVKPKLEKAYRKLIEEEEMKSDIFALNSQQMKLEHKEK